MGFILHKWDLQWFMELQGCRVARLMPANQVFIKVTPHSFFLASLASW